MSILERIQRWVFPPRASTQTWMFLTFALFVGVAVGGVGLYAALALRGQTRTATQEMLLTQARRVAAQVDSTSSRAARQRRIRQIEQLTDLRVTVADPDAARSERWSREDASPLDETREGQAQTSSQATGQASGPVTSRAGPGGDEVFYVTLYRPRSGLMVRVGQPASPLYQLVEHQQTVLVVGMGMALAMALLGSWLATYQVVTPLKRIRNSAQAVNLGRFDGEIEIGSRAAEFQDLANSLNRASDAFREKIDELERVTQLQKEFIGNVSHEVRNPIHAIGGYLEALSSPGLPEKQRKNYAEKALGNLHRLQTLFDDLIDIAQLEYREDLVQAKPFDLQHLIDEVSDMLRPKATEEGLALQTENPPIYVDADRARIRQVLTNLIDNAIAYTPEGTVRCRTRRRLEKVRVEVVDTGQGIDEEHLERVFDRFYRAESHRSRDSGGTGLGLSIVQQILQAHGEEIHVESTKGRGTRFWFELPHAETPAEATAEDVPEVAA
jgi:signal transduction histidine kinase